VKENPPRLAPRKQCHELGNWSAWFYSEANKLGSDTRPWSARLHPDVAGCLRVVAQAIEMI
jgi:hypothetical protein